MKYKAYLFIDSYRTRDEVQEVRKLRDPINQFKNMILEHNLVTPEELQVGGTCILYFPTCLNDAWKDC